VKEVLAWQIGEAMKKHNASVGLSA
jgi:hypothetical protein